VAEGVAEIEGVGVSVALGVAEGGTVDVMDGVGVVVGGATVNVGGIDVGIPLVGGGVVGAVVKDAVGGIPVVGIGDAVGVAVGSPFATSAGARSGMAIWPKHSVATARRRANLFNMRGCTFGLGFRGYPGSDGASIGGARGRANMRYRGSLGGPVEGVK